MTQTKHTFSVPSLDFETAKGRDRGVIVCGVDEVGRGPLAGPVMAAAVIIPQEGLPASLANAITDSKKLSEKQREALFPEIIRLCPHAIAEASVEEIDDLNILHASLLAMCRAVEALPLAPAVALIDGNKIPKKLPCEAEAIVKGDSKSLSIAAASIIAKVTRDRFMKRLADVFPAYGWAENAGYPTKSHCAALVTHGLTVWHRKSFGPVKKVIGDRGSGIG